MFLNHLRLGIVLSLTVALVGCGGGVSNSTLNGTRWVSDCGTTEKHQYEVSFTETDMSVVAKTFAKPGCVVGEVANVTWKYGYTVGQEIGKKSQDMSIGQSNTYHPVHAVDLVLASVEVGYNKVDHVSLAPKATAHLHSDGSSCAGHHDGHSHSHSHSHESEHSPHPGMVSHSSSSDGLDAFRKDSLHMNELLSLSGNSFENSCADLEIQAGSRLNLLTRSELKNDLETLNSCCLAFADGIQLVSSSKGGFYCSGSDHLFVGYDKNDQTQPLRLTPGLKSFTSFAIIEQGNIAPVLHLGETSTTVERERSSALGKLKFKKLGE